MRDRLFYEQLKGQLHGSLQAFEIALEQTISLLKHCPISDEFKQDLLSNRLKIKSAWYACMVNSNIDELLIPEYLESKQSRNILFKKETDQFYKSIVDFEALKPKSMADLYNRILYSEEAKAKTFGMDLFSSQVVNSADCPDEFKQLFDTWQSRFEGFTWLECLLFEMAEWHQAADNGFSNQRQCLLFLNYQLWQRFGSGFQLINLEQSLHQNMADWSSKPQGCLKHILESVAQDLKALQDLIIDQYCQQVQFDRLRHREQTLVNFLIEQRFDLSAIPKVKFAEAGYLIKCLNHKGFIELKDVEADWNNQEAALKLLLNEGIVEMSSEWDGKVNLYLNTSLCNVSKRLYKYQNVQIKLQQQGHLDQFKSQTVSTPIVPIDTPTVVLKPTAEQGPSRPKAFFG
ncbi:MAG: hypothetical protein RLZZ318_598 [Bacteroidota bacterium]